LRIALAQFNASVGDIKGNVNKMQDFSTKAFELGADIVVLPEMSVCGYPPEDQLDRVLKGYVEEASQLLN
jgi:NAD+ synthase (glutamine-hydrolysing)